ncbi:MAG: Rrf2 family transcriptional regulator [Lachnospiraceae bacterium]|nr:Rrf2 family transcriptional regulator [Lachnospiraceae bacterium]
MGISTRGKNALKFMLDLATYSRGQPIRLKDIARRQHISEKYLEHIVSGIQKADLVQSLRGKHGGYILRYPPEEYTVGQILKAVEGNMAPTDCVGENGIACENKRTCVNYIVWERLDAAINRVLEEITLKDMLEWQYGLLVDQYVI